MGPQTNILSEVRRMTRKELLFNAAVFSGFVILCMGGGGIMRAITANDFGESSPWYTGLEKPCFTPPSAVFGPVWSVLYLLMAIAAFAVWTETGFRKRPAPLILFFIQLALNFIWLLIFGKTHDLLAAFVEMIVLWVAVLLTMILFYGVKPWTHFLLLPYLAWLTFSSILNYSLHHLNPDNDAQ